MLAALALAAALQAPAGPDLAVTVDGVRGAQGLVRVELCTADTFLGDHCALSRSVKAQEGRVVVVFPDTPAGEYAVQAYHDRNGDGQVNRNLLGVPVEELGFSRSPPLGLHGPRFVRAAFAHGGGDAQAVTVTLRKLP